MRPTVLWLRRDLRLRDHPALDAAATQGPVIALFVLDPALLRPSGAPRRAFLLRTLRTLDADLLAHGGRLVLRHGAPEHVVPGVVEEAGAAAVHVSADFGPYGAARDVGVERALDGVPLLRTGSPYAVDPGLLTNASGRPYRVFSAFYRAWCAYGWPLPAASDPAAVEWRRLNTEPIPDEPPVPAGMVLPDAGEAAAWAVWHCFRHRLDRYAEDRDRPDREGTSRLSPHLKFGTIHPRSLLADLGGEHEAFRRELAWREFYASILHAWPSSAREYVHAELAALPYATGVIADERFAAWTTGRTGYPIVDAGMRQLLGQGWLHNRVRMVVASFLVKDLHIEWTRGARHFMRYLVDADLASNQHGWQWVAGTGADAAPFFRIFNPVTQGRRFDPDGSYIRYWVPELTNLRGPEVHEPWRAAGGPPHGYPEPIVDHASERAACLAAYRLLRAARP